MGNSLDAPVTEKVVETCTGNGLSAAVSSMQGWRREMEDDHACVPHLPLHSEFSLFGVFDGHGGVTAANGSAAHIVPVLRDLSQYRSLDSAESWAKCAYHLFLHLDTHLSKSVLPPSDRSGCTANVCIVGPRFILTANAGDARAVLSRGGVAVPMSEDHKPSHPVEQRRIQKAGGEVLFQRVNGELAVSRALGDFSFKARKDLPQAAQQVTCAPDVRVIDRQPHDEFLVIACDGIWDVMSSEEVVAFVRQQLTSYPSVSEEAAANALLDLCLEKGSRDNMTACVVRMLSFRTPVPLQSPRTSASSHSPINLPTSNGPVPEGDSLDELARVRAAADVSPRLSPPGDWRSPSLHMSSPTPHLDPLSTPTVGHSMAAAARSLLTDTLTPTTAPVNHLTPLQGAAKGSSRSLLDQGRSPSTSALPIAPAGAARPDSAPMSPHTTRRDLPGSEPCTPDDPSRRGRRASDTGGVGAGAGAGAGADRLVEARRSLFSPSSGRLFLEPETAARPPPVGSVSAPLTLPAPKPAAAASPALLSPAPISISDLFGGSPVPLFPASPAGTGNSGNFRIHATSAVSVSVSPSAGSQAAASPSLNTTMRRKKPPPLNSPGLALAPVPRRGRRGRGRVSPRAGRRATAGDVPNLLHSPYAQVSMFPPDSHRDAGRASAKSGGGSSSSASGAAAAGPSAPSKPITATPVPAIRARYGLRGAGASVASGGGGGGGGSSSGPAAARGRRGTAGAPRRGRRRASSDGGVDVGGVDAYTGLSIDEVLAIEAGEMPEPPSPHAGGGGVALGRGKGRPHGHLGGHPPAEPLHAPHTPNRAPPAGRPRRRRPVAADGGGGAAAAVRPPFRRVLSDNGKDLFSQTLTAKELGKLGAGR